MFNDREFYDRPLTGLRAFRLQGGALTGVFKKQQAYIQGENLARCFVPKLPHKIAAIECGCGFHGYYDGSNNYMSTDTIAGLIEGYGLVTVGIRGFRASKARLVALIVPYRVTEENRHGWVGDFLRKFEETCKTYPTVPVYDTEADALAKHPLTPIDCEVTLQKSDTASEEQQ